MVEIKKLDLYSEPETLFEGLEIEKYVIGTYSMMLPGTMDIIMISKALCIEQSTGTWTPVPEETPEVRKRHVAKVVNIWEIPDWTYEVPKEEKKYRNYVFQIAYPWENFGPKLSMMFSTIMGNISMAGPIKLMDIYFPKSFLQYFKGPKFGIEGIRKILNVPERPLVNNMIKPCVYTDPKIGAKLAYEVAMGGCDVIKDDELLANTDFNTIEERVTLFMEALDKAKSETGEKALYTVNITDEAKATLKNAERVQELGANAIMINFLTAGWSIFRDIAEDPSIKIPILGHMDFSGVLYEGTHNGVALPIVLGKLPRLIGSDMTIFPAPYGKAPILPERYYQTWKHLVYPMGHIKPSFPMPSGGITVGMVEKLVNDCGLDVIIAAGGGIHAHPDGPRAGAKAFRQAIEAVMKGISVKEFAKDHKELGVALGTWGTGKTMPKV